jgi:phosphotriesterase-related protein
VSSQNMVGRVQSVLGSIPAEEIGITMMHEHFLLDLRPIFVEPDDPLEKPLAHEPVGLDNLSWVTMNWSNSEDNLVLDDLETAVREAKLFKHAGGSVLVDVTSVGLGRDPKRLRDISQKSGVHVVMGASYYHARFHPPGMDDKSEDEICQEIVTDITEGVDGTGICAGIIGEVGCTMPLHPNEEKVLRASARAQKQTGAPISIHPGLHVDSPVQIVKKLVAAGAEAERIVMGHIERTGFKYDQLLELAKTGCYLEYDWFGQVVPSYPYGIVDVPSDGERIIEIASLISDGYGSRILVSQDVGMKHRLASFGGPGYAHIARYVQEWMRALQLGDSAIEDILVNNPRRILQFV